MSIPKFTLFEHRIEEKYNNIVQKLPEMIKALKLSNSLDDGDLKEIKEDVYDNLTKDWNLESFEIKKSDISVQNQEFSFEKSIAAEILGTPTNNSLLSDYVNLYYAIYTVPYSGNLDSIKYTTVFPTEHVYLTNYSNYFSLTIYNILPIAQSAAVIKAEKDRIIDLIEKNQEANEAYIQSREEFLKDAIDKEIDFHFKSGRDEISDNSLL